MVLGARLFLYEHTCMHTALSVTGVASDLIGSISAVTMALDGWEQLSGGIVSESIFLILGHLARITESQREYSHETYMESCLTLKLNRMEHSPVSLSLLQ